MSWSRVFIAIALVNSFVACGGGGGGQSSQTLYYPYETVYGDLCTTQQPTPGCTFLRNGNRITVTEDPDYNRGGKGSDDLWYVEFDSRGRAAVYNNYGQYQYSANASEFAGHIGGTTIGVGQTGFFWENVADGVYWLGRNGVLYSANSLDSNYGQAINDQTASEASDSNFSAINSDANKSLIQRASQKLVRDYGFKQDKAIAVASALNSWAVAAAERGTTSEKDMDKTFKAVFGVKFSDALAAVKDLSMGEKSTIQDLTNRSASELGLKPHQAQKFMKNMYKKALASYGYEDTDFTW
jgi:uncharacterized protein YfiM (DUF2279 family)